MIVQCVVSKYSHIDTWGNIPPKGMSRSAVFHVIKLAKLQDKGNHLVLGERRGSKQLIREEVI